MMNHSFDPTPAPMIGFDDASYWWVAPSLDLRTTWLTVASFDLFLSLHQGIALPRPLNGLELARSVTGRESARSWSIVITAQPFSSHPEGFLRAE